MVRAIADMVTQSAGPYTAVGMGMALAAHQVRAKGREEQMAFLRQAGAGREPGPLEKGPGLRAEDPEGLAGPAGGADEGPDDGFPYPREVRFEVCETYQEVVQAIADMVTQSAGPYTAVGMGMAQKTRKVLPVRRAARMRVPMMVSP